MNDKELVLFSIRRDLEKSGIAWNAKAPVSMVMATAQQLIDLLAAAEKRIAQLEKQTAGMQKILDHAEMHSLKFMGSWQRAAQYYPGSVVRHQGGVFVCLADVLPGKAEPNREGSRWDRMI